MIPIIAHIYGPIVIYSYGLMMALGLLIFSWLILHDPKRSSIISTEHFNNVLIISTLAAVIGCRLMYILSISESMSIWQMLAINEGGLSLLGGIIAILIVGPLYLYSIKTPILPLLDLAALYAPILYTCARIGCFLAGCCYGQSSSLFCAITYCHPASHAPLGIPLLPTQLLSALNGLIMFFILKFIIQKRLHNPGQLLGSYLIIAAAERFMVDFLRGDRIIAHSPFAWLSQFSVDQWVALATLCGGIALVALRSKTCTTNIANPDIIKTKTS